jgi:effector-binding domain-containing protein
MIEVRVEHVEPATVAYVQMRGPYSQMPQAFGTLYTWVQSHSLVPNGMPRGTFFTDPATTPEADALWELQTALAGDSAEAAVDETGCGVKRTESRDEARTLYRGPYDLIGPTYEELTAWIAENGYSISGPPAEVYLSDPAETSPKDYLTEVRFPVRKG